MDVQTHIPRVLCALHNFIRHHDPTDTEDADALATDVSHVRANGPGIGELAVNTVSAAERQAASNTRDQIAQQMWQDYQHILHERGEIDEDIPN
jgi:hypothetical protein